MMMVSPFFKPSASSMPCSAVKPVIGIAPACRRSSRLEIGAMVGRHRDIFGVEAALRILPIVAIDLVADLQPPHPRADFCDDAGAVIAQNQWKMRLTGRKKSFPNIGVPSADARGIDRDQDFTGIHFRNRQSVSGDDLR